MQRVIVGVLVAAALQTAQPRAQTANPAPAAPAPAPVTLDARKRMIEAIVGGMSPTHRHFLVSFECGQPDWPLLGVPSVEG